MPISTNPFTTQAPGSVLPLPGNDHFEPADHLWSEPELDALTLAYAARRPLLVRGEPGSGKSQLARAAARVLESGWPIVEVIHPRFEAMDLLYRFDAVARLSDAQLRAADGQSSALDATNQKYVSPGALWRAFDHVAAGGPRAVLLIDEIDKADADLPNSLLDALGNRSFEVPPLNGRRVQAPEAGMPLIVITTNEERELPAAFVRRCVVLNVSPPKADDELKVWLLQRALSHQLLNQAISPAVAEHAAAQVLADRHDAAKLGYPKVGLAELVDLLTALKEVTAASPAKTREAEQLRWLRRLSAYALVKHANQDQRRLPVNDMAEG